MRGAPGIGKGAAVRFRIIPADAGSTRQYQTPTGARKDHPRGCGEHHALERRAASRIGSSPRMRGALLLGPEHLRFRRIIPADAGSTRLPITGPTGSGDHPRGCGEHDHGDRVPFRLPGSSPRMRGALPHLDAGHVIGRIIPADAGSTVTGPPGTICCPDHPRGCGEHIVSGTDMTTASGSSPRMRGAHLDFGDGVLADRIIPADAGSTAR